MGTYSCSQFISRIVYKWAISWSCLIIYCSNIPFNIARHFVVQPHLQQLPIYAKLMIDKIIRRIIFRTNSAVFEVSSLMSDLVDALISLVESTTFSALSYGSFVKFNCVQNSILEFEQILIRSKKRIGIVPTNRFRLNIFKFQLVSFRWTICPFANQMRISNSSFLELTAFFHFSVTFALYLMFLIQGSPPRIQDICPRRVLEDVAIICVRSLYISVTS